MKKRMMKLLVCPVCRGDLSLHAFSEDATSKENEVEDGLLTCKCGRWYPIIGGIPRMLPDSLRGSQIKKRYDNFLSKYKGMIPKSLESHSPEKDTGLKRKTLESFGFQWNMFHEMFSEFRDNFLNYISPLKPSFFKGKLVLDVGCGFGRHTYYSAEFGAEVVGLDLSHAVESAYRNVRKFPNAHIVQGDVYNLPFRNSFDFIFSIGVIHHLPDPKEAYLNLTRFAKKDSDVFIWVYGRENRWFKVQILGRLRKITRKMPHGLLYHLCFFPAMMYHYSNGAYHAFKAVGLNSLAEKMPFKGYAKFPFRVKHADAFDFLATPEDNYYRRSEMEEWVKEAGLKDAWITDIDGRSWRVFGTKR